jgi:hypothetical protein
MNCAWEREGNQEKVCPDCGGFLYTQNDNPTCKLCGAKTVVTSGSHLGATWECPKGHYEEVLSARTGRWCYINGQYQLIERWQN